MIIPQFKFECVNVYMSKKSEASFMYLSVSSMKAEWLEFSFKGNPFDFLDFDEERMYHKVLRDIFAAISDKCRDAYET